MYLDKQNLFSEDQAITSTARSTNVIDLGALGISKGDVMIQVLCQVTETFTSGGATTLEVDLMTDSDETISSGGIILQGTSTIAKATLVQGYQFSFGVIPVNAMRYVDLNFTVATGPFTAGKIMAGLVLDRQTNNA